MAHGGRPGSLVDHGCELVATEAREGRTGSHGLREPVGGGQQECVAGLVAERVVDHLQVVHADQDHRDRGAGGAAKAIHERRPVEQTGQWIAARLHASDLFNLAAPSARRLLGRPVREDRLEHPAGGAAIAEVTQQAAQRLAVGRGRGSFAPRGRAQVDDLADQVDHVSHSGAFMRADLVLLMDARRRRTMSTARLQAPIAVTVAASMKPTSHQMTE
jgi:hypothetical protein